MDLHLAREGTCRADVVCPGIEVHSSASTCEVPELDAVVEAHWEGVDFDGRVFSIDVTDPHGKRGHLDARLDTWRHGASSF